MSLNIPATTRKRVVVIGGGFGGMKLIDSLRRSGFQLVLIDQNNYHQFQPLLYQVATAGLNPGSIAFPFRKDFLPDTLNGSTKQLCLGFVVIINRAG